MKRGEHAFFYHSGDEKGIVGIVEITAEYRLDPADKTGTFGLVDVKAVAPLPTPVTLAMCKAEKKLAKMVLLHNSRLSVQPVTDEEWTIVCRFGGLKRA